MIRRDDLIQEAKGQETETDVAMLAGNYPSMRLILVWPQVGIDWDPTPGNLPARAPRWQRIWHGVRLDAEEIAMLANIPRAVIEKHIRQAQVLGWIYPDNTVHQHAHTLALASLAKRAEAKPKSK